MKILNLGRHAQSKETRMKIGIGVQIGWQRRREKLMLQETCYFEWQNLIAEASRRGNDGEKELQWDSYKVLDEKLEQEWLESVEQRKNVIRPKGCKRAPKSPEQRRKISEAISAKWSDPVYRDRVYSALSKYHGTGVGLEKKPRRRPTKDTETREMRPAKKKSSIVQKPNQPKKIKGPLYKDPLANSKLEMIKNIRAKRVSAETNKNEAIKRARILIAEAQNAAKALEIAAMKSPLAQASLMETRKLIAQAIQSIESIDGEIITSDHNEKYPIYPSTGFINHLDQELDSKSEGLNGEDAIKVNGNHSAVLPNQEEDFDFGTFALQNLLNKVADDDDEGYDFPLLDLDTLINQVGQTGRNENSKVNGVKCINMKNEARSSANTLTKKWVRGRLIEVTED